MKTALALFVFVGVAIGAALFAADDARRAAPEKRGIALGDAAPMTDVKMEGVDGKSVSIAELRGKKGTLVIFSCNHCPYAVAWESRIAAIGNAYRKKDIGVLLVNSNDPSASAGDDLDSMKQRAKDRGFEFPYVVDGTSGLARAFGASKTPEAFLFDAEMKLVYHGAVDDNSKSEADVKEPWLKNALDALLAGRAIEKAESKAIGCTIKFRPEPKTEPRKDDSSGTRDA